MFSEPAKELEPVKVEFKVFANTSELAIPTEVNELEPVPEETKFKARRPLEIAKLPAKELEPVKLEIRVLDNVNDLLIPTEPAKELEALVVKDATVPTKPLDKASEPAKELEPVKVEFKVF